MSTIKRLALENQMLKEEIASLKIQISELKQQISEAGLSFFEDHKAFVDNKRDPNRVSVIMTVFNCEEFVERAIRSVLNQTHTNLELLIVDDHSTDNSLKIISKFAKFDPRVRVFRNIERRGTYWSKNSVIHKTTGSYITMLDADDYDMPDKLEKQLVVFSKDVRIQCVTCLNDRKVSEYSQQSEKISLGYPSMMFRYQVFQTFGHYDTLKFGADSEFYDRLRSIYGPSAIYQIREILQVGPRRKGGLTGLVPEGSNPRRVYVNNYRTWHKTNPNPYFEFPQKSRPFPIPDGAEVTYTDLSNSTVYPSKSTSTLPVIMCVWKRVDGFNKIVQQLNDQTFKNFKLFIWNNNPSLTSQFANILKNANFEFEIHNSEENIGGFGRFMYAKKIRRTYGLMDYCVFLDDDQTFDKSALSNFLKEAKPNTISAQWGWEFTGLEYYGEEARRERKPNQTIHYAGTGGMIADMRVFDSEGLYDCPEKYWFVEDLWLSFYANHHLKYKLVKSGVIMKNGDDEHSLYKRVLKVKTPMLQDLVKNYGWSIL